MKNEIEYSIVRGSHVSVYFPSAYELMEFTPKSIHNRTIFNGYMEGDGRYSSRGHYWFGPTCTDSKQAIGKSVTGDHELYEKHLVDKIELLRKEFDKANYQQMVSIHRRKPVFSHFGDELDIHKVYQGQLDKAWRKTKRITVEHEVKLVTIFINIGGTAGENVVGSLWRAAAAVYLVDTLSKMGKSVKVIVGSYAMSATECGKSMTTGMVVKDYNQKLSMERLAAMSHLGFHRSFNFAARCCSTVNVNEGMGASMAIYKENLPIQLEDDIHKGHAKIAILQKTNDANGARNAIKSILKQFEEFTNEKS